VTAVALAALAALSFATSTVVQHRAATDIRVGAGRWPSVRLFLRLFRSRAWLAGEAASAAAFVLHGLSLRSGPVILVQPVLSCGLVITLALGALIDRRHPERPLPAPQQWAAAGVVVAGLFVFLRSAQPDHGRTDGRPVVLLGAVGISLLLYLGAAWRNRNPQRGHRALALGIAAGSGFGIAGVLLKQVVAHLPTTWSTLWPLLAMFVVGGASLVCAQAAYHAGALIESLPALTVLEPVVAVVVASWAYGERLHTGWLHHLGQGVGLVCLAVGVVVIARAETTRRTALSQTT
jgi:hypothetical protein